MVIHDYVHHHNLRLTLVGIGLVVASFSSPCWGRLTIYLFPRAAGNDRWQEGATP